MSNPRGFDAFWTITSLICWNALAFFSQLENTCKTWKLFRLESKLFTEQFHVYIRRWCNIAPVCFGVLVNMCLDKQLSITQWLPFWRKFILDIICEFFLRYKFIQLLASFIKNYKFYFFDKKKQLNIWYSCRTHTYLWSNQNNGDIFVTINWLSALSLK